jgi:hypothetical protein
LQELPGDLDELFRNILTRDSYDKAELVLCIHWVLFAERPLSPEELFHTIYAGTDPEVIKKWKPEHTTADVVKLFILNSSKGLAEITVSSEPTVQFIHESVKDFLLKENGLGWVWPEFENKFHGQSHEQLKLCCFKYVSIEVTAVPEVSDELSEASDELSDASDKLSEAPSNSPPNAFWLPRRRFPFLGYAAFNLLYHADAAEGGGISQTCFIDSFPPPHWAISDSALFREHKSSRHIQQNGLLHVLAERNMENLIRVVGFVDSEQYGALVSTAGDVGIQDMTKEYSNSTDVSEVYNSVADDLRVYRNQLKEIEKCSSTDFVSRRCANLLLHIADLGLDELLARLIQSGKFYLKCKDSEGKICCGGLHKSVSHQQDCY